MKALTLVLLGLGLISSTPAVAGTSFREQAQSILNQKGLTQTTLDLSEQSIAEQSLLPSNQVSFSEAFEQAIQSFLTDSEHVESPLALIALISEEIENKDQALPLLMDYFNRSTTKITLLQLTERPENGESPHDKWIIELRIRDLSDHIHWAIIDRSGKEKPYNYSFN